MRTDEYDRSKGSTMKEPKQKRRERREVHSCGDDILRHPLSLDHYQYDTFYRIIKTTNITWLIGHDILFTILVRWRSSFRLVLTFRGGWHTIVGFKIWNRYKRHYDLTSYKISKRKCLISCFTQFVSQIWRLKCIHQ